MLSIFKSFLAGWTCKEDKSLKVDQASEDSFPASDPPAWTKATPGRSDFSSY